MRLENVFAIEITLERQNQFTPITLPSRRDRQTEIISPKINLLEFLKLYRCDVNTLIAKRNSPMGKVMPPSQRLIYAIEFIPKAETCIKQQGISDKAKALLHQAIGFYQQKGPLLLSNAVFHEEWEKAFHGHAAWPLDQTYPSSGLATLDRFISIKRALENGQLPDDSLIESFELDLKHLSDARYPGNWLKHTYEANHYLAQINTALENAQTLCPTGRANRKSNIMHNVFVKYFNAQIQPWISQLHRFGQSFEHQLADLSQGSSSMETYHESLFLNDGATWLEFQQNWRNHVQLWQYHLSSCKLMPRAPITPSN